MSHYGSPPCSAASCNSLPLAAKVVPLFPRPEPGGAAHLHASISQELPPDVTVGAIAEFGFLIGDPTRIAILVALLASDWLPASALARCAGITPQTASGHLGRLVTAGLLRVRLDGRRRLHGFASPQVRDVVRALYVSGSRLRWAVESNGSLNPDLRLARVCQGHLAGRLSIELAEKLTECGPAGDLRLSTSGRHLLQSWGVSVELDDVAAAGLCRDWSEGAYHLDGSLGRILLERSLKLGWLRRREGTSALIVTASGLQGFRQRFGIEL